MTGIPVEQGIRSSIMNILTPLNVSVHPRGKKFEIWDDVNIIADILAQKDEYPTSIISVKSWIGTTQIRETYAYAYFSKTWHGQKNIRLFMISLHPIPNRLMKLIRACMPFIDGVYSLSGSPYYDDLVAELHNIYT